jgi:hypothetical protein
LYEFTLATHINASPARVWRALCEPTEVVQWDSGVVEALDAPADYPRPGQHVHWRYRSGPFRLLHDRPQEVEPERRLRSLLSLGPYHYDETYILERIDLGCRLSARLVVWTAIPIVGALVDGTYLGPSTRRDFEASLAAIKRHCESEASAPLPSRDS